LTKGRRQSYGFDNSVHIKTSRDLTTHKLQSDSFLFNPKF